MGWRLEFAAEAERDFEALFDHLLDSYITFGEPLESAFDHARTRLLQIRTDADRILTAPNRGERHDDILPGCRSLTFGRASFWFKINETRETVTVLAVFFGGQQERWRMMARLLQDL